MKINFEEILSRIMIDIDNEINHACLRAELDDYESDTVREHINMLWDNNKKKYISAMKEACEKMVDGYEIKNILYEQAKLTIESDGVKMERVFENEANAIITLIKSKIK
jgi:hypothetical protein